MPAVTISLKIDFLEFYKRLYLKNRYLKNKFLINAHF